jgi:hypothetical protein
MVLTQALHPAASFFPLLHSLCVQLLPPLPPPLLPTSRAAAGVLDPAPVEIALARGHFRVVGKSAPVHRPLKRAALGVDREGDIARNLLRGSRFLRSVVLWLCSPPLPQRRCERTRAEGRPRDRREFGRQHSRLLGRERPRGQRRGGAGATAVPALHRDLRRRRGSDRLRQNDAGFMRDRPEPPRQHPGERNRGGSHHHDFSRSEGTRCLLGRASRRGLGGGVRRRA